MAWARGVGRDATATGGSSPGTRSTPPSSSVAGTRRRRWSDELLAGRPGGREPDQHDQRSSARSTHDAAARPTRNACWPRDKTFVDSLLEAQFTGPVHVGLVELALTTGRIGDAAATAADGIARLDRTRRPLLPERSCWRSALAPRRIAPRSLEPGAIRRPRPRPPPSRPATGTNSTTGWPKATPGRVRRVARRGCGAGARPRPAERTASPDPAAWQAAVEAADGAAPHGARRMRAIALRRRCSAPGRHVATRRPHWARPRPAATALGAEPLLGWIESLARRSRIEIPTAQPSAAARGIRDTRRHRPTTTV